MGTAVTKHILSTETSQWLLILMSFEIGFGFDDAFSAFSWRMIQRLSRWLRSKEFYHFLASGGVPLAESDSR